MDLQRGILGEDIGSLMHWRKCAHARRLEKDRRTTARRTGSNRRQHGGLHRELLQCEVLKGHAGRGEEWFMVKPGISRTRPAAPAANTTEEPLAIAHQGTGQSKKTSITAEIMINASATPGAGMPPLKHRRQVDTDLQARESATGPDRER